MKDSIGIVIRKPGKLSYTVPRAYRTISLLSTVGKTVGKYVTTAISNRVEVDLSLYEGQCGFRPYRSTMDILVKIVDTAE